MVTGTVAPILPVPHAIQTIASGTDLWITGTLASTAPGEIRLLINNSDPVLTNNHFIQFDPAQFVTSGSLTFLGATGSTHAVMSFLSTGSGKLYETSRTLLP